MRHFPATPCLSAIALALLARPALADTTISAATTANIATATAAGGQPDNVVVASGGSITPASGTAITVNSSNTVANAGTISASGIDGAVAIGGGGGFVSTITNSGTITIDETYAATDANGDGVVDGAFAQGANRYGILVTGNGTLTGAIVTSGTITIKGNSSGGIVATAPITGAVQNTGAITVVGDNAAGIRLGNVGGTVALAGATSVTGQNTVGVALTGDVGGAVVVHNAITATGYSATTLPTNLSSLTAGNLLQGGPALAVGGNIAGGLLVATATTSTDTTLDTDLDGIGDTTETTGVVKSIGSAPALLVGAATRDVALGLVSGRDGGLVVDGTISGAGIYAGFDATAIRVGGLGGAVSIAGGATIAGTVSAITNGGTATGLSIGAGATMPMIEVSGTVSATQGTTAGGDARAILIGSGASVAGIVNTGGIAASIGVGTGRANAILDQSGTLTSVANTGTISATDINGTATAIDVSANAGGFAFTQGQSSTLTTPPKLTGAILTGSGNDLIAASAGTITSAATLGAGNDTIALGGTAAWTGSAALGAGDDSVTLSGTSSFAGALDFGTGADSLVVNGGATFAGTLANTTPNVALTVNGGTATFTATGITPLASLAVNAGTIGVRISPLTGAATLLSVAGATRISGASTIKVSIDTLVLSSASYTVLKSGTLSGSGNFGLSIGTLPYLLTGSLAANDAAGTVTVNLQKRPVATIGLRASEAAGYDAVYAAIAGNATLSGLFLGITDRDATLQHYRQMLPDHAGGVFDLLNQGERMLSPTESATPWANMGSLSLWAQQAQLNTRQDGVDTPGYKGTGWGVSAGGDLDTGAIGRFGLALGYTFGDIHEGGGSNEITANLISGGAYWLGDWGGLHLGANASFGTMSASSKRSMSGTSLTSDGDWSGTMMTAAAKVAYRARLGILYVRPSASITYSRLHERDHTETGGGAGFDLAIDSRNSDELAATGLVAVGIQFGGKKADGDEAISTSIELQGGRRQIVGGQVGSTTAHFAGGQDFTLEPENRASGYLGSVRALVGSSTFKIVAGVTAEERDGYRSYSGQVGLRGAF